MPATLDSPSRRAHADGDGVARGHHHGGVRSGNRVAYLTAYLTAALQRDTQVRVVDTVPTKLVIADGACALLFVHSGPAPEPAAVVAHSSGLLVSLVALFESLWRQGLPLRLGEDDRVKQEPDPCPAAMDLQILSLILIGLTDVSIARELGLGARTVQRRLKHLMELSPRAPPVPAGMVRQPDSPQAASSCCPRARRDPRYRILLESPRARGDGPNVTVGAGAGRQSPRARGVDPRDMIWRGLRSPVAPAPAGMVRA